MIEKLIEQIKPLSIEETKTVFENVKKLLHLEIKKRKEFNFYLIPDTTESIILSQKDYPNLPFNEVEITNPKEFKEKVFLYHQLMVEAYYKGLFKVSEEEMPKSK